MCIVPAMCRVNGAYKWGSQNYFSGGKIGTALPPSIRRHFFVFSCVFMFTSQSSFLTDQTDFGDFFCERCVDRVKAKRIQGIPGTRVPCTYELGQPKNG